MTISTQLKIRKQTWYIFVATACFDILFRILSVIDWNIPSFLIPVADGDAQHRSTYFLGNIIEMSQFSR